MTDDALVLIGRGTTHTGDVFETHADRLRRRGVADTVHVATYEQEPDRELRDALGDVTADRVFAVPVCAAHTYDTLDGVPAALSTLPGTVRYCEPLGQSPAVTDVLAQRGAAHVAAAEDAALVLVGFGSSSTPYQRQTAEYHAARIREQSDYGEVVTCYLLQNPAVECVRYNVSSPSAVAVPLFAARSAATEERIPAKLELDRGGIAYADPLGDHPRITDAIQAEVEKQSALATPDAPSATFEANLTDARPPVATDGDGR